MWINNTATTSMVVPIAMAVLDELYPKVEKTIVGRRRRASVFKDRSEVDFQQLVANASKNRNKLTNGDEEKCLDRIAQVEPKEDTKFLTNLDYLNE